MISPTDALKNVTEFDRRRAEVYFKLQAPLRDICNEGIQRASLLGESVISYGLMPDNLICHPSIKNRANLTEEEYALLLAGTNKDFTKHFTKFSKELELFFNTHGYATELKNSGIYIRW